MDEQIFAEEQAHLTQTYEKLQEIGAKTRSKLDARVREAIASNSDMQDELAIDLTGEVNLETYVEYEALNKIIDEYNLANEMDAETLRRVQVLLRAPYFAKITVQIGKNPKARDIYLGTAGMMDEKCKNFIVDWRSPVAEVYYNQSTGKTTYKVDNRTITANLKLRRQFDITQDKLNAYFDTTVAIEDPLLLKTLSSAKGNVMHDITATIQKEQNAVIRHEDVPVLLVNGIAGSGKTSVLLQRIAYLFYQHRETLSPREVYLITPNPVFRHYISEVLPDMGEANPNTLTWADLMDALGLASHGLGQDAGGGALRAIDAGLEDLKLTAADFQDLRAEGAASVGGAERVIAANQAFGAYNKYKQFPAGVHRCTLVKEDLHAKIDSKVSSRAGSEDVQDEMMSLSEQEMFEIFGQTIVPLDEAELREYAKQYLEWKYAPVHEAIENGEWLRIDRIGMRMLGQKHLSSAEHLYLKLSLAGNTCKAAKYVMIDEVQDYTVEQLMVLAKYFSRAHFLLLGDPNQAVKPNTATFSQIKQIFEQAAGARVARAGASAGAGGKRASQTNTAAGAGKGAAGVGGKGDAGSSAGAGKGAGSKTTSGGSDSSGDLVELQLMTSYRSTPEITDLFTRLMSKNDRVKTTSVHAAGTPPAIIECATQTEYETEVRRVIDEAIAALDSNDGAPAGKGDGAKAGATSANTPTTSANAGITAIITTTWAAAKQIREMLTPEQRERVQFMEEKAGLPECGVILLDVALAKGLEFNSVIVPDAQERAFEDVELSKRKLYTAISRATQKVTILSNGKLTRLLAKD